MATVRECGKTKRHPPRVVRVVVQKMLCPCGSIIVKILGTARQDFGSDLTFALDSAQNHPHLNVENLGLSDAKTLKALNVLTRAALWPK